MNIDDRMKGYYELRQRPELLRRTPVIVRIDGRAFHSYTRSFTKPFSPILQQCMVAASQALAAEMQGFVAAYTQSDEASFLLVDYATLQTDAWFGYNQQKLASISASIFTAHFNQAIHEWNREIWPAYFDARAFNVPREEVCNYFVWRAKDWVRNSVSMLARSKFSHKELLHKPVPSMHEMLHGVGVNWADLSPCWKNGVWLLNKEKCIANPNVIASYATIETLLKSELYPNETPTLPEMPGCSPTEVTDGSVRV